MRIIVCGGRDFNDGRLVHATLTRVAGDANDVTIVHGGAPGADSHAAAWARVRGHPEEVHWADWNTLGRPAGPIRNQKMVDAGADLVVAFPGGRGTDDCVTRARFAGIPVQEIQPTPTERNP